tara:strand:+ start:1669 stop:2232 length:564 start_codon:yes stop_codon:yes gene_type:complete
MSKPERIIVGISGASGIQYGVCALKALLKLDIETHLIMTKAAQQVRHHESSLSYDEICDLASHVHHIHDVGCAVASGSFQTIGMIVTPCSMHTLAEIANGFGSNALTRAADVILKERRKLILMVRESPLNQAHIENMLKVTQMGGIICPPVPAFYNHPKTIDDMIKHSIGRILDLLDIHTDLVKRWQ